MSEILEEEEEAAQPPYIDSISPTVGQQKMTDAEKEKLAS